MKIRKDKLETVCKSAVAIRPNNTPKEAYRTIQFCNGFAISSNGHTNAKIDLPDSTQDFQVDSKKLERIVHSMDSKEIEVTENKGTVTVTDGGKTSRLQVCKDPMPEVTFHEDTDSFTTGCDSLHQALSIAISSTALQETFDGGLTGVLIHSLNGEMYIVGGDRQHLCWTSLGECHPEIRMLIGIEQVKTLKQIIPPDGVAEIFNASDNTPVATVKAWKRIVSTTLTEDNYPNWAQFLPSKPRTFPVYVRAQRSDLIDAMSFISVTSDRSISIKATPDGLEFFSQCGPGTSSSIESSTDESETSIECAEVSADSEEDKNFSFQPKTLLGFLKRVQSDEVEIGLGKHYTSIWSCGNTSMFCAEMTSG